MKKIKIGQKEFSKIICGTNAVYGRSHFSEAKDREYQQRFTDEKIKSLLKYCHEKEINTVETSANEKITLIVNNLKKEGININLIGSTRIDKTSPINSHYKKLDYLIEHKYDICIIHAQIVDRPGKTNEIRGLKALIDKIHEAGLTAGISTHYIKTVEICEKNSYGVDTYLFPLNLTGFVYPGYESSDTINDRINLIKNIPKSFILMKTLGAGRIPPDEGLQFIAENSKDKDIITIGFGSEYEIDEALFYYNKYF